MIMRKNKCSDIGPGERNRDRTQEVLHIFPNTVKRKIHPDNTLDYLPEFILIAHQYLEPNGVLVV